MNVILISVLCCISLCVCSWWMQWTHWTGMFSISCMFSSWSSGAVRDTSSVTLAYAALTSVGHTHTRICENTSTAHTNTHIYCMHTHCCIILLGIQPRACNTLTDTCAKHTYTHFPLKGPRQRITWNFTSSSSSSSPDPWLCLASCPPCFIRKQKLVPSPPELLSWRVNLCHTACCLRMSCPSLYLTCCQSHQTHTDVTQWSSDQNKKHLLIHSKWTQGQFMLKELTGARYLITFLKRSH